jgi:3-oxoacyl-[acyl-carrier-protein] synthase-3
MAAACALEPTGMSAVLGGDPDEVTTAIEKAGLYTANRNGAGQNVAAGALDALATLSAEPPAKARVISLAVAGAFHTPFMAPAEQALAAVAAGVPVADPARIIVSNLDGTTVGHGREMLQRLVRQVTAPVRWDLCMRTLRDLGVTGVIELPPAGTLAGLIKRELKGDDAPEIVTLRTPDDLGSARDLIARHGGAPGRTPASPFRVVVAPTAGLFRPADELGEGRPVTAGQVIGQVVTREGPIDVPAHATGPLTEWLAHYDDPVAPGRSPASAGRNCDPHRRDRRSTSMTAGSRILAMGHYQPSRIVTNDDLAKIVDTNDAWIRDRVGIAERRVADQETVADMATAAAEKALAGSGLTAADIDMVAVATCSSIDRCPNVATRVAARLGISAPAAFDLNTACSGFSYALGTADHAIRAGAARNAIVIGAEKLSDITDWTDRTTAVLFGDGAGAAVVTAVPDGEQPGIGPVLWGSAPDKGDVLRIEGRSPYIQQEGQIVFRWATTALAPFALEACEKAGVRPDELAAFVPHQANTRIIDGIVKRMGFKPDIVIAKDLIESGNTSAASVPLALSKLVERREVPSGAPVLLFGFGGGLTYAGQVIRCP